MDYLPPVACVELSGGRYFICLIDINGAADLPRQLGGWTADRNDHQLLSTLLTGRLVIKANGQAMEEVDQAGIAGYFTFETSFSRLEAQLEILQSRFEAALGAPERRGLAALTEPRWPRLDRDAFLSPNPQSSIEGSGRAAFSVGSQSRTWRTHGGGWNLFGSQRPTRFRRARIPRQAAPDSSGTT